MKQRAAESLVDKKTKEEDSHTRIIRVVPDKLIEELLGKCTHLDLNCFVLKRYVRNFRRLPAQQLRDGAPIDIQHDRGGREASQHESEDLRHHLLRGASRKRFH